MIIEIRICCECYNRYVDTLYVDQNAVYVIMNHVAHAIRIYSRACDDQCYVNDIDCYAIVLYYCTRDLE